jgi:hypothetical protein
MEKNWQWLAPFPIGSNKSAKFKRMHFVNVLIKADPHDEKQQHVFSRIKSSGIRNYGKLVLHHFPRSSLLA